MYVLTVVLGDYCLKKRENKIQEQKVLVLYFIIICYFYVLIIL